MYSGLQKSCLWFITFQLTLLILNNFIRHSIIIHSNAKPVRKKCNLSGDTEYLADCVGVRRESMKWDCAIQFWDFPLLIQHVQGLERSPLFPIPIPHFWRRKDEQAGVKGISSNKSTYVVNSSRPENGSVYKLCLKSIININFDK